MCMQSQTFNFHSLFLSDLSLEFLFLLSFSYDFENWQLKFITTGIGSMDTYMAPTITGPVVYKEYFS